METKNTRSVIMQIVRNTDETAPCANCGNDLSELGSFTYAGKSTDTAVQKDEECLCKKCGKHFILQYQYFDEKGHVNSFVFNGDVNDGTYNWQDQLTSQQKETITNHLKDCQPCMDRMTEEALTDAWISSLFHRGKLKT